MSTQTRELRKSQQSFAGTDRSSTSIASLEKIANRSSQGQSVQRHSTIRSDGSANPPLSKTLRRVPVRLPRWMSMLQICQCASAAVIVGAGVTSLAIGGRAWLQPTLLTLTAIACPTFLVMITNLSALPKIMRWKSDHRLCIAANGLACLFWGMSFSAACAIENAGAGAASYKLSQTQALAAWTAAIMAACASGVEFFLFLASTLVMIYHYHLALVDYQLCKFKAHVSYRQKILALDGPLPSPNPAFRKSAGPSFPPRSPGPRVPQRSSLRAIAHLNNQTRYPGLKSRLSEMHKASKSLEEMCTEAATIPLPDSPPHELDVSTEFSESSTDTCSTVDVPVSMKRSSGRLPLRRYSSSPLNQEIQSVTSPANARDSALGISPMFSKSSQPSLMDLALKSPRVPPKKRPTPLAPIALPAPKLSPKLPIKQFSEVLSETSWPLPALPLHSASRSASFSSTQRKSELIVPAPIVRASSSASVRRRTDIIVPLENPRAAPLSPAQQKEEIVRRKGSIQAALNQEKEQLARRKSEKRNMLNQEKEEVARQKSLKKETLNQEKEEVARQKSLKRASPTKEKTDLTRLKSLKRDKPKSPGSANFAENAKRFSTLAPSFRIARPRPRPNLSLKGSTLAPSTTDDATTTKRRSWGFSRPDSLDSPPLTSLTFSNWGESNESNDNIAAPPPSPATLAASIKTNNTRKSVQKQKKAAKAKAKAEAAAKKAKAEKAAEEEKSRNGALGPEAERYYTRSPYDFDSEDEVDDDEEEDDDDDEEVFALDTNCVPGSAQQNPLSLYPYEQQNWSTTNRFGDGVETPRSMSIYSHQGSHSVYSVDTQGLPPLPDINDNSKGGPRRPMSSLHAPPLPHLPTLSPRLMSPAVPPLFHRVSLNQYSASPSSNSGVTSPVSFEYEEEIEDLARGFREERGDGERF